MAGILTSLAAVIAVAVLLVTLYLVRLNHLLKGVPDYVKKLSGPRWTPEQLRKTYKELREHPIDYTSELPPKLDRRYIVTGGSGLVGGYIVLQLLARGNPPESIRIIDIRKTERNDMLSGPATKVDFVQTDITVPASVDAAFAKPWDPSVASLPLTVFHTAAVIIPSDRSKYSYAFPERVNVGGTKNVLASARRAGADIFSSTSSASIRIRPVEPFVAPWAAHPKFFWQVLDEADFDKPLRHREEFFGNYPASKAAAERLVCGANDSSGAPGFRTGCIRPANGVYGNPTDNTVGGPLAREVNATWIPHVVQSFVHGANVAVAHLHHEAALARGPGDADSAPPPQAGRPFVVTDPSGPIAYADLYAAIETLSVHPFRTVVLPPVAFLLLSHLVEWYHELPYRHPFLRGVLPEMKGEIKYLQPGLFSICTHLVAFDGEARKPVEKGGLGYKGVLTTMQGMALEILEWNQEHSDENGSAAKKTYTTSVSLAEKIMKLGAVGSTVST